MSRSAHFKGHTEASSEEAIRRYLILAASRCLVTSAENDQTALVRELDSLKLSLEKLRRQGGLVVVTAEDQLITAFRAGTLNHSYKAQSTQVRNLAQSERCFLANYGISWLAR